MLEYNRFNISIQSARTHAPLSFKAFLTRNRPFRLSIHPKFNKRVSSCPNHRASQSNHLHSWNRSSIGRLGSQKPRGLTLFAPDRHHYGHAKLHLRSLCVSTEQELFCWVWPRYQPESRYGDFRHSIFRIIGVEHQNVGKWNIVSFAEICLAIAFV